MTPSINRLSFGKVNEIAMKCDLKSDSPNAIVIPLMLQFKKCQRQVQ